ncbi:hypothetical protein B0H34DRAFT_648792 [Crassisporium funariophilum]|nr:hypothetical protein B0H34DRAFT_648792 [Crassisporium funariophilum]
MLERVPELWFEDGSTVFQASHLAFRLHASVLSARSSVFSDILSPNPRLAPIEKGLYLDGSPLITLHDPAEDAQCFFLAIYDSGYFERPPARSTLIVILAILRLSTKYEVHYLRQRALHHLYLGYPDTLDGWDNRFNLATFSLDRNFGPYSNTPGESLAIFETCEKVQAKWMLPAILYECCRHDLQTILDHPRWEHGIEAQHKKTLLIGYVRQLEASREVLKFLTCPSLASCPQRGRCSEIRGKHAHAMNTDRWSFSDPLGIWDDGDWESMLHEGMCELCLPVYQAMHDDSKVVFWARLPEIYCLPSWSDLQAMKNTELGIVDL